MLNDKYLRAFPLHCTINIYGCSYFGSRDSRLLLYFVIFATRTQHSVAIWIHFHRMYISIDTYLSRILHTRINCSKIIKVILKHKIMSTHFSYYTIFKWTFLQYFPIRELNFSRYMLTVFRDFNLKFRV